MDIEEYNIKYPDDKKDPNKYEYVKVEIDSSFQPKDILLILVDIYKKIDSASR